MLSPSFVNVLRLRLLRQWITDKTRTSMDITAIMSRDEVRHPGNLWGTQISRYEEADKSESQRSKDRFGKVKAWKDKLLLIPRGKSPLHQIRKPPLSCRGE